jgi:hypothetical protein
MQDLKKEDRLEYRNLNNIGISRVFLKVPGSVNVTVKFRCPSHKIAVELAKINNSKYVEIKL